MECPSCQFENPEGAKFCNQCGAKLEITCSSCGKVNPPGSIFCNECGQNLLQPTERLPQDLSFDEKLSKIQRYLPKGLTEKILSQRDRIEGERKHVTVMFCDMVGFTPLVEKLGPEDAYALMDQVQEILIHKVHEYEGTVNQLTGDGLMALFGAPIALEDAPQRAIRSSLAIHREMARFSERMREESDFPVVKMRIGINTGPVVVGTVGNDLRVEFAAVGDTVNTASRVEGLAEPGTTCVTEETFKLSEGFFRFEALGGKEVKGKEEAVKVYQVIAPTTRKTRFDVSAERGLTRFVGRERELELLLDGFERAKTGRGQAFSIVGEAGVGKSRLLYEFRKALAQENVTFLEGKCLSYSRGVAYHAITEVLKSNFYILEGDNDSTIREKVAKGLQVLELDGGSTLPYMLELLSVEDSGIDKIPMSPEGKKDRIIETIRRMALKGSEIRPLVMAIEDLHWSDTNSEGALKHVLDSIPGTRVMLIFSYRPEFIPSWGGKSFHSQITLNRLSNRESLSMLAHMLGSEDIDCDLKDLILEKTEGIPFFVEEFVRSLQDLKIIKKTNNRYHLAEEIQKLIIPSTIQDVIMARMDRLAEGAREVLQVGAAIEREFTHELIEEVTGLPERELLSCLSALKDAELLYERGIYPKSTYVFKHALTREVAYDSILTSTKKRLHQEIGNKIEKLQSENIHQHYEVLAEHYIIGQNWEKGAEYSKLASKKAEKTASLNDAIAYSRKRIACLDKLPLTDDLQKKIIDSRTVLGLYIGQMNYFAQAKKAIDPIIEVAQRSGYKKRLCQIYTILGGYYYWVEEDFAMAYKHLEESLRIAEEEKDIVSLALGSYWLGMALTLSCEFGRAFRHIGRGVEINIAAGSLWGVPAIKSAESMCHYWFGRVDASYQASDEAVSRAEASGDIYSKGPAWTARGLAFLGKGFLQEAVECFFKAITFAKRINFFFLDSLGEFYLGEAYFEIGDYQEAKAHYEKVVPLIEEAEIFPSFVKLSRIGIARAEVMSSKDTVDLKTLSLCPSENRIKLYEGWMRRYLGEIFLNIDDQHTSEAQHWIEEAIEADERNGMRFHLGRDYALYAELFKRKGDREKATEQLGKAIEIYKECGADGWVTKAEEEMGRLS